MPSHPGPTRSALYVIYVILVILLILTAIGAKLPLGAAAHDVLAFGISVVKTALIVFVFMEVRYEKALVRVFAGAGVVWLALFYLLIFSDYLTRP